MIMDWPQLHSAHMPGAAFQHDPWLVLLSYAVAALGSYAALTMVERRRQAGGKAARLWQVSAAAALGGGIWSMHFLGMLAFSTETPVAHDPGGTLLSLLIAVGVVGIGFHLVRHFLSWPRVLGAGMVVGLGVAAMHHTGMAAMRFAGTVSYRPELLGLSILIAVVAAMAAMCLAANPRLGWRRALAALVMGVAVCGMHYVAMAATVIQLDPAAQPAGGLSSGMLATAVALATLALLALAIVAAVADHRLSVAAVREAQTRASAEQDVRRVTAAMQALLGATPDAVVVWDGEGRILTWNPAAERMFGWNGTEALGLPVASVMPALMPAMGNSIRSPDGEAASREKADRRMEVTGRGKDGGAMPLEVSLAAWEAGGQMVHGAVIRDISERLEAARALRHAKEKAEQADLSKSKFLAAASHDLRQPVQSLLLFLDVLKPHVLPTGREAFDHLGRGVDSLRDLLDSLLDISRLDSGVFEPSVQDFPVREVVEQIGEAYAPIAAAKGLGFEVERCTAVVRSDRTLFGRMIRNLVENALRYSETGRIAIACVETEGRLRIEVRDTGIGIPSEQQERIFEEFHQVGNPERDRNQGLGLGLAIVRRLSVLLEHPVHLRSSPGEGSVFSVEVPLGDAAPSLLPEAAERTQGAGRFAVLIDDDSMVLTSLAGIFEAWGYAVLVAGSAEEAAERLRRVRRCPDVVVSDYRLRGGRTGTDTVLGVRELCGAKIPGILLTGETGAEVKADAAAHGLRIIHKPITPRRLGEVLSELLSEGTPVP